MKIGKIVLSAAAFAVTVISAFSFKSHTRGNAQAYGTYAGIGTCTLLTCFTRASGGGPANCNTQHGAHRVSANHIFTASGGCEANAAGWATTAD